MRIIRNMGNDIHQCHQTEITVLRHLRGVDDAEMSYAHPYLIWQRRKLVIDPLAYNVEFADIDYAREGAPTLPNQFDL